MCKLSSGNNVVSSTSATSNKAEDDGFEASFHLSVDDKTRPYYYFGQKRTATIHTSDFSGAGVSRTLRIRDGRGNQGLKLDDASFELVDCPTNLSTKDFYDLQSGENTTLKEKYYEEVATFIKSKIGCDECTVFHHQVRNTDKQGKTGVQGYAPFAPHSDAAAVSADQMAIQMAPGDPSDYERYCYMNLWRNIADSAIENDHLVMLDERTTVKPDDYITADLFGAGYNVVQHRLSARHSDIHKWYYFPKMQRDEAILFKNMDSDWTKSGRICFHMSANDANISNYAPRESIEVRVLCYWKNTNSGVNSMPTEENTNAALIKDPLQVAKDMSSSFGFLSIFAERLYDYFFEKKASPYSGKPEDYLTTFVGSVNYFPKWPKYAKDWAKGIMMNHKNKPDEGIANLMKEVVNDSSNHHKTKNFTRSEKKEIVDYLLSNDTFMQAARKHFGSLLES